MLIIHNSLGMGGVETFILRLARERYFSGLNTKILLIANPTLNNHELLSEVEKYADVFYIKDIVFGICPTIFNLSCIYRYDKLVTILENISKVHVTYGNALIVAEKILNVTKARLAVSVGFYHSMEFCWGKDTHLPYYESVNRDVLFNTIPVSNLFLFSSSIIDFYREYVSIDLSGAATFRIGTVSINDEAKKIFRYDDFLQNKMVRMCSVGRLVDFKKYNIWMLDVVRNLCDKGFNIQYDIYGDGPLYNLIVEKIAELSLGDNVSITKHLKYSDFDEVVGSYDIFVGSGTSIIQSAALGVCSVVGIESIDEPLSYGYLCDVAKFDYNLNSLNLPMFEVETLITNFIHMSRHEKQQLVRKHIECCYDFSMKKCSEHFEEVRLQEAKLVKRGFLGYVLYDVSRLFSAVLRRVYANHPLNSVYDRK
ncbi:TPA: glycosyltransferase [Aeromonas sobria]|nr:glycosyltransferase [Aeromonas sobria]